jgi:hypothetical protein
MPNLCIELRPDNSLSPGRTKQTKIQSLRRKSHSFYSRGSHYGHRKSRIHPSSRRRTSWNKPNTRNQNPSPRIHGRRHNEPQRMTSTASVSRVPAFLVEGGADNLGRRRAASHRRSGLGGSEGGRLRVGGGSEGGRPRRHQSWGWGGHHPAVCCLSALFSSPTRSCSLSPAVVTACAAAAGPEAGAEHGRGGVDGRGPSAGARYLAVEPEVWGRDLAGRKRMDRDEREGEGARRKGRKRMDGVLEINI